METGNNTNIKPLTNGDPTSNVLLLVEAAVKRLDDIQIANSERIDEKIKTNFSYIKQLAEAESKRIDAIRAVDVGAVAIASERAAAQALVLSNQVAASAETLRNLVSSTAAGVAVQLQQISAQLSDRITLLEKGQYETKGLAGVPPQLLDRLSQLEETKYKSEGKAGISMTVIVALATIGGGILIFIIEKLLGK